MPAVNIDQERLFAAVGRTFTTAEFRDLCFRFGIELEEDSTCLETCPAGDDDGLSNPKEQQLSERPYYKVDIPANRPDLLSSETIISSICVYMDKRKPFNFSIAEPTVKLIVKSSVAEIRPIVIAAIVRNVNFDSVSYESFMSLQDKLHNNLCRNRTLASMGTHDFDKIQSPVYYEARKPQDIKFVALNETENRDANALFDLYRTSPQHKHLARYLHIIDNKPLYPVIRDEKGQILSLPPIINSEYSKITLGTTNVFIEITATDVARAEGSLYALCAFLCEVAGKNEIERVDVVSEDSITATAYAPSFRPRVFETTAQELSTLVGVALSPAEIIKLAASMNIFIREVGDKQNSGALSVVVPLPRTDVLHVCDIAEDVAIAYGYEKLPRLQPKAITVGRALDVNLLGDRVRHELASAGYTEVLALTLCSSDDVGRGLRHEATDARAVELLNPQTAEFQVVRTRLLPGLLKALRENKSHPLPQRLFEVGDVVWRKPHVEGVSILHQPLPENVRCVCAVLAGVKSDFESVHGLLDLLMVKLGLLASDYKLVTATGDIGAELLPNMGAEIMLRVSKKNCKCNVGSKKDQIEQEEDYRWVKAGSLGVVHPQVLGYFKLLSVVTMLEFDLTPFI